MELYNVINLVLYNSKLYFLGGIIMEMKFHLHADVFEIVKNGKNGYFGLLLLWHVLQYIKQ